MRYQSPTCCVWMLLQLLKWVEGETETRFSWTFAFRRKKRMLRRRRRRKEGERMRGEVEGPRAYYKHTLPVGGQDTNSWLSNNTRVSWMQVQQGDWSRNMSISISQEEERKWEAGCISISTTRCSLMCEYVTAVFDAAKNDFQRLVHQNMFCTSLTERLIHNIHTCDLRTKPPPLLIHISLRDASLNAPPAAAGQTKCRYDDTDLIPLLV